jgi:hypothetical protein
MDQSCVAKSWKHTAEYVMLDIDSEDQVEDLATS